MFAGANCRHQDLLNTPKDREHVQSERLKLRAMYKKLFAEVADILHELDPMNISCEGAPSDEYEPEARTILPRLQTCNSVSDARRIIFEEFMRWFGEDAGPEENYQEAAERIWADKMGEVRTMTRRTCFGKNDG